MVAEPTAMPVAIPVPEPILTIPGLLLDQEPPDVASENVEIEPLQIAGGPKIGDT